MRVDPALLAELEGFPENIAYLARTAGVARLRSRPQGGGFSLVEHAWHLADLEREGFGARIYRLATEEEPFLPDFDGQRTAAERRYLDSELDLALWLFAAARAANLRLLQALPESAAARTGEQ